MRVSPSGEIAFTRTPCAAPASAQLAVIAATAPFDAPYALIPAMPSRAPETTVTTEPPRPDSTMARIAWRTVNCTPRMFTSAMARKPSSSSSHGSAFRMIAAFATTPSTPPYSRRQRSVRACATAQSATEPVTATAWPPEARIASTVCSAASPSMSPTTADAPASAAAIAYARPRPCPAPVTMMRFAASTFSRSPPSVARASRGMLADLRWRRDAASDPGPPSSRRPCGVASGRPRSRGSRLG